MLLAIDPGPEKSAVLIFDGRNPVSAWIKPNWEILDIWDAVFSSSNHLAIEMVASYGMAVGRDVFETVYWIGRFCERFDGPFTRVYRKDVKLHLCNSMRAKDANIRQALLDRYPKTGGGKTPQIGTKKQPGPLYGISSHCWSALAVAVTWYDLLRPEATPDHSLVGSSAG